MTKSGKMGTIFGVDLCDAGLAKTTLRQENSQARSTALRMEKLRRLVRTCFKSSLPVCPYSNQQRLSALMKTLL